MLLNPMVQQMMTNLATRLATFREQGRGYLRLFAKTLTVMRRHERLRTQDHIRRTTRR